MELSVSKCAVFLFWGVSVAFWPFCNTLVGTTVLVIVAFSLMSDLSVEVEMLDASVGIAKAQRMGTNVSTKTTRNILTSFGWWTETHEKLFLAHGVFKTSDGLVLLLVRLRRAPHFV